MSEHAKMPPASHQVSATSLKLLIQQIHPHVRVERDSGMCVARDLYELWGRSPYTRMFVVSRAVHQGQPRIKRGLCVALVGALELISAADWNILISLLNLGLEDSSVSTSFD